MTSFDSTEMPEWRKLIGRTIVAVENASHPLSEGVRLTLDDGRKVEVSGGQSSAGDEVFIREVR